MDLDRRENSSRRRAAVLADQITQEVIDSGWTEGTQLGSEPELLRRYGVSRGVFRQAVGLLEYHGVARMSMGRGGGLVVTRPDAGALAKSIALFLAAERVTYREMLAVRSVIEEAAARLATERVRTNALSQESLDRLARAAKEEGQRPSAVENARQRDNPLASPHVGIAISTGNPLLILLIEAFARITAARAEQSILDQSEGAGRHVSDRLHGHHEQIIEAIMRGDADGAVSLMRSHLEQMSIAIS